MRRATPKVKELTPGVLRRNSTSFPVQVTAKLHALHERYQAAAADPANPEHRWATALKYYQYLVRAVMCDPEYGIGADGNARGLLAFADMGFGKTRLAVAVAMAMWDVRPVIVLLPHSLQANFRATVDQVLGLLHPDVPAAELARLRAEAATKFAYVSMDAYNAADQVGRGGAPKGAARSLNGALVIIDEAHNFFRAIINSASEHANARRVYDQLMAARDLRLLFLTGSPASKDPFELVPCFNLLAGRELLPTQYETFVKLYVDREHRRVRNRERLANRLIGLVSRVGHASPARLRTASAERQMTDRDIGWFPEELPTIVSRVPMGHEQYRQYLLARDKEVDEGRGGEGATSRQGVLAAPPLALPGSEKKAMRSYYVKSRTLSLFSPPREWRDRDPDAMPDDAFTAETAPKLHLIAERVASLPGVDLVYSQFVASGLRPLGRFLKRLGFEAFVPVGLPAAAATVAVAAATEPVAGLPSIEPRAAALTGDEAAAVDSERAAYRLSQEIARLAAGGSDNPKVVRESRNAAERWLLTAANSGPLQETWPLHSAALRGDTALLQRELEAAGVPDAAAAVERMRSTITKHMAEPPRACEARVKVSATEVVVECKRDSHDVRYSLYPGQGAVLLERGKPAEVARAALRYLAALEGGQQLGLPRAYFEGLYDLGVRNEAFASPFNSRLLLLAADTRFCSLFPDTDAVFGSLGSFLTLKEFAPGGWYINPPYVESLMDVAVAKANELLAEGSGAPVVMLLPRWDDAAAVRAVRGSPWLVAEEELPPRRYSLEAPDGRAFVAPFAVRSFWLQNPMPSEDIRVRIVAHLRSPLRAESEGRKGEGRKGGGLDDSYDIEQLWALAADLPVRPRPITALATTVAMRNPPGRLPTTARPILTVGDRDVVIAGTQRLARAMAAGWSEVPTVRVPDEIAAEARRPDRRPAPRGAAHEVDGGDNPPLTVQEYRVRGKTLQVVRDDLLPAGTKQRAVVPFTRALLAALPSDRKVATLLYTAPYNGFGPVAAAFAARRLGLQCLLILSRKAFGSAAATSVAAVHESGTVRRAREMGAKIQIADTWDALVAAGKAAAADPAVFWYPLGYHADDFGATLADHLREASAGFAPRHIWMAAGTGALALAVAAVFPAATITVVPASLDPKNIAKLTATLAAERRIEVALVHAPAALAPYPTVAGYDERAWDAAVAAGADGDCVWNVAGVPDDEPRDFPYRTAYMPAPLEMFDRLREIGRGADPWDETSRTSRSADNRLAVVRRTFPEDFDKTDSLTDHFVEPVRIRCRERDEPAPATAWRRLSKHERAPTIEMAGVVKIIRISSDTRAQRERVYAVARGCNLFNNALAVYLLRRFKSKKILDATAGWGDRLLAAHVVGAELYRGWDTNPALQAVYASIADALNPRVAIDWLVTKAPFESARARFAPGGDLSGRFDTALFCPPYFDKELYLGPNTSTDSHPTVSRWYAGFYRPAVAAAAGGLQPGGHFLAYVTAGRMHDEAAAVLKTAGLVYLGRVGFQQIVDGKEGAIRDTFVWRRPVVGGAELSPPTKKYAIISGEVSDEARVSIVRAARSTANLHGEIIKAVLVSKTGAEGLDMLYIRRTHQAEPYWDRARDIQVKARGRRLGSHDALPREERDLQPYLYVAAANQAVWGQMPPQEREARSIDEIFMDRAAEKFEINEAFRELLAEVSLEAEIFGYSSCRTCVPTGVPLFHDDPNIDIRLPDPCEVRTESNVEARPIEHNGVTYYYTLADGIYAFYTYRKDLGGHAPVDPSDPVIVELRALFPS